MNRKRGHHKRETRHEKAGHAERTKLHQADVILGKIVNNMTSCVQLTQRELVVVLVVQHVQQVGKEWMQVLYATQQQARRKQLAESNDANIHPSVGSPPRPA